jgi:uncharacterized membrane protein YccC
VARLRYLNSELSLLFADAFECASTDTAAKADAAAFARGVAHQAAASPARGRSAPADRMLPDRPSLWAVLKRNLHPLSPSFVVVARVAVATVLAGTVGALLSLQHAYWAMAAAVVVLHQDSYHRRTIYRGLQRVLGTWLGVGLAAAVLAAHPDGLSIVALVAAMMVLNFLIEITVVRNYTVAVVFITAAALLTATGGRAGTDLASLLLARGLDNAVGCAVAVTVFLLMPTAVAAWLPKVIADALDTVTTTIACVSTGTIVTPAARAARRDLQQCALRLHQSYDNAINGTPAQREAAGRVRPAMEATQQLVHRTIAECWRLEWRVRQRDQSPPPGTIPDPRAVLTEMVQSAKAHSTALSRGRLRG